MTFNQRLDFHSKSNVISGNLAGKTLHCVLRGGAALPPPGTYAIMPPLNDPVYGKYALLVAAEAQSAKGAVNEKYGRSGTAQVKIDFSRSGGAANAAKLLDSAAHDWVKGGASQGQAFVLSAQPIVGRNNLVVTQGFADLIAALELAGGASVTIS